MILLGLPSCDTCRKALAALRAGGAEVTFRDVRADPLAAAEIEDLLATFGARLVNRASTTWRGLSAEEQAGDPAALLARHPALMKRPVIREGDRHSLGWDESARSVWL